MEMLSNGIVEKKKSMYYFKLSMRFFENEDLNQKAKELVAVYFIKNNLPYFSLSDESRSYGQHS